MNVFEKVKHPAASILSSPIAMILIISTLLWATGAPLLMHRADAAGQVTNISDTLSDSDLGVATKHTLRYTSTTTVPAAGTISFIFDPAGNGFSLTGAAATSTNFIGTGLVVTDTCSGTASEVVPSITTGAGNEGITFTVCAGDSIAVGAITIVIGTSTPLITNPAAAGSYRVTMTTSAGDYGETRVAIIDDVVVTASVDTVFTFSITGLATSTVVNGETLTGTASSTFLAFGTLSALVPKVLGQRLNVVTNAAFGYSVTVVEDQNLLSSTGADIDVFANGTPPGTPGVWTSPTNVLGSENTYGHIGLTSDDAVLSGGDEFGTQLFAGDFVNPRQVMYHNAPADGVTAGVGSTTVAYKVEIASLQEAGADYTNTLTYVATPIF
ncbi:MAG: hypothetical protein KBD06_02445 [Candidatus Pacebacteria bacterium]|nr:hypothetical protein [Candidatus Paceibacterota bacterium]